MTPATALASRSPDRLIHSLLEIRDMAHVVRPLSRMMARELSTFEIDAVSGGVAAAMMPVRTDWYCSDGDEWHVDDITYNN